MTKAKIFWSVSIPFIFAIALFLLFGIEELPFIIIVFLNLEVSDTLFWVINVSWWIIISAIIALICKKVCQKVNESS